MSTRRECVHYAGIGCRAGVPFESVRDPDLRLPCIEVLVLSMGKVTNDHAGSTWISGSIPCAKRQWKPEAAPPALGKASAALEAALAGLCPTCKEPVRGEAVVGDKVYAMPCRHILRGKEDPRG